MLSAFTNSSAAADPKPAHNNDEEDGRLLVGCCNTKTVEKQGRRYYGWLGISMIYLAPKKEKESSSSLL
jgi:hypothetical protein